MKRKIFFIILLLLALFGFKQCTKAYTLSYPNTSCADNTYNQTTCGTAGNGYWNDLEVYTGFKRLGNPGSTGTIYKSVNFHWDNEDLCVGKNLFISGRIWGLNQLFVQTYSVDFYIDNRPLTCSFNKISNSSLYYQCSGYGGSDFLAVFNLHNFASGQLFEVGVGVETTLLCNASTEDIININTQINNSIGTLNESTNLVNESVNKTNDSVNRVNETLRSDDTTGAESEAQGFFDDFETEDQGGLSSIITAPLSLIENLDSNTCQPLTLNIPFINQSFQLPCLTPIYEENFGTFLTIYQSVITGFVAYWVCIRIYSMIKAFKDPEDDKIEVIDL